ncbi:hypothetical protein BK634_07750 [Pseudomonas chlororaphis]|jgi:hypothetical protein|uniref:Uncharacterized protein n=1 Tax=Pseudomonas morbosilactucae TaxID=2938197 RepID=A0A9X1YRL4_9PSED|nr:hypothetical protein [Pseudomonas morbosilactucae]MCK9796962.1 hypothetical protein [Pseudomonas morbosilactucae]MCK9813440.1 hypothetical protein [Pseudomonas morbosilactucae]ROL71030.1 hypothetical protein BK634_07750 [Pseudomonas chlororaphis]
MDKEQLLRRVNSKRNGCRGKRLVCVLIGLAFLVLGVALALRNGPHPAQLLTLIPAWPFFYLAFFAEDQTVESWFDLCASLGN